MATDPNSWWLPGEDESGLEFEQEPFDELTASATEVGDAWESEPSTDTAAAEPQDVAEAAGDDDPQVLVVQVDDLRDELVREFTERESAAGEKARELDGRVDALEAALAEERAAHDRTREALERGRTEAGRQATELRACLGRIRGELGTLDAGMAWFEYWAGGGVSGAEPISDEESTRG